MMRHFIGLALILVCCASIADQMQIHDPDVSDKGTYRNLRIEPELNAQQPHNGPVLPVTRKRELISTGSSLTMESTALAVSSTLQSEAPASPTGYEPLVLWSPDRQAIYQRMLDEQHPLMAHLLANADRAVAGRPMYGDSGQYATIAYQVTGDPRYGKAALRQLSSALSVVPNSNKVREYHTEFAICLEWLRPFQNGDDKDAASQWTASLDALDAWAIRSLGEGQPKYVGGFSKADSDQLVGQYFGLAVMDKAFDRDYLTRTTQAWGMVNYPVGGLTPTNSGTIRDIVASYADMARGGVWIESGGYNQGTLSLIILGVEAVGPKYFPEYTALYPQFVNAQLAEITPDLKDAFQWGDEEHPHGFEGRLFKRLDLLHMMSGVEDSRELRGMIAAIKERHPTRTPWWRALWLCDPYGATSNPGEQSVESTIGIYLRKSADELFAAAFPSNTAVHHAMTFRRFGDFSLYQGGEWVIGSPIGYSMTASSPAAGNCVQLAGLGPMTNRSHWVDNGAFVGETSGPYYATGYYSPPPPFVYQYRRTISRDRSSIVINDAIDMDDPKQLPNFHRYSAADRTKIEAAPLVEMVFHMPVKPTVQKSMVSWTTPGGKAVRLSWKDARTVHVIDERKLWEKERGISESERKWQVRLVPNEYSGGAIQLTTRVTIN